MKKKFYPPVVTAQVPAIKTKAPKIGVKFKAKSGGMGKKILGAGKKIFKRTAIGLGVFAAAGLVADGLGARSRRYEKAPKFGEDRDLTNKQIGQMTDYYFDD
tara:strand:+ start:187 stop:492 length:306 start_codon:yes stop_codon:yes gene_type:complete